MEKGVGGGNQIGSLWGLIRPDEMGSRLSRDALPKSSVKPLKKSMVASGSRSLLETATLLSDGMQLRYRPEGREAQMSWEYLLAFCHELLGGECDRLMTTSATDDILSILKDDTRRDLDKKSAIEALLSEGSELLSNDKFTQLVNLGKRITDYDAGVERQKNFLTASKDNARVHRIQNDNITNVSMHADGHGHGHGDEDEEVAVVFDDEEDEEAVDWKNGSAGGLSALSGDVFEDHVVDQDDESFDLDPNDSNILKAGQSTPERLNNNGRIKEILKTVDLESLVVRRNSSKLNFTAAGIASDLVDYNILLPAGSSRKSCPEYDEIFIPPPNPEAMEAGEKLFPIAQLPLWMASAFPEGISHLNRIQSRVRRSILEGTGNVLLCAPTGAGKTNVAMMAILSCISQFGRKSRADPNLYCKEGEQPFKIVYIAPMRALVQEMVTAFQKRLGPMGIGVGELTGESHLSRAEIAAVSIIVTTPEKWDVVTRKGGEDSYARLVRLLILDEIHLLHDSRGPVLEALVARHLRQSEEWQHPLRIIGLSATLPNYRDVARFLRAEEENGGVYFFGPSFRPVPLMQTFLAVGEGNRPLRRQQVMNKLTCDICLDRIAPSNGSKGTGQVLVFVHSRNDTVKTARFIKDAAIESGRISPFLAALSGGADSSSFENPMLGDLVKHGIGVHHAGLSRSDRLQVEALFSAGHLSLLISTATLAWGVNLPAHTVVIKGTQVYNAEEGCWVELSNQDVLQMLGRAGRPQYDTVGEGIIVTGREQVNYYLSLLNVQLPIESQLPLHLADHLNAQIQMGNIRTLDEAVSWLGYTFFAVRLQRDPMRFGLPDSTASSIVTRAKEIVHTALLQLDRGNLIRYDQYSGSLMTFNGVDLEDGKCDASGNKFSISGTELGRIASHYYLDHQSIALYNGQLRATGREMDLMAILASSHEFRNLTVRAEERIELVRLAERVPLPPRDSSFDFASSAEVACQGKVIVLLQAYISRLSLSGFALAADMQFVKGNAPRILRALFEMCLRRGWARIAMDALELCRIVERRQWRSHTPLWQILSHNNSPSSLASFADSDNVIDSTLKDVLRRLERKDFPWERLFDLDSAQLGELLRMPSAGPILYKALKRHPRLYLNASAVPITRELLSISVDMRHFYGDLDSEETITIPEGQDLMVVWIIVEDGERVLFADSYRLRASSGNVELKVNVPISDPLPPVLILRALSDRWLGCDQTVPIILRSIILPEKRSIPTAYLEDLELDDSDGRNSAQSFLTDSQIMANDSKSNLTTSKHVEAVVKRLNLMILDAYRDCGKPLAHLEKGIITAFNSIYGSDENVLFAGRPWCDDILLAIELAVWRALIQRPESARIVLLVDRRERIDEVFEWWSALYGSRACVVKLSGDSNADSKLMDDEKGEGGGKIILGYVSDWNKVSQRWRSKKSLQRLSLLAVDCVSQDESGIVEVVLSRTRMMSAELQSAESKSSIRIVLAISSPVWSVRDLSAWIGSSNSSTFNFDESIGKARVKLQTLNYDHCPQLMVSAQKSAFSAIEDFGGIVIIPDGHLRSAAMDFMSLNQMRKGRNRIDASDPLLSRADVANDSLLKECLFDGVGFIDRRTPFALMKELIYRVNADRLCLLISNEAFWSLPRLTRVAHLVIMGTQKWSSSRQNYMDYSTSDIVGMLSVASEDVLVQCHVSKKSALSSILADPVLTLESGLETILTELINAEIASGNIRDAPGAIDYLTWSLYYRRLIRNPAFYGLDVDASLGPNAINVQLLSAHMSDLVDRVFSDLEDLKCICKAADCEKDDLNEVDKMDGNVEANGDEQITAYESLNLGLIAAHYGIQCQTVEMFALSLNNRSRVRAVIDCISAAGEFENLSHRDFTPPDQSLPGFGGELGRLGRLARFPQSQSDRMDGHWIVNILLQAHFSRQKLSAAVKARLDMDIIPMAEVLIQCIVDVLSSLGYLEAAMAAMTVLQMLTQAIWHDDSPLCQAFDGSEVFNWASGKGVKTVYDIDEDFLASLPIENSLKRNAVKLVNAFPSVELSYHLPSMSFSPGEDGSMMVTISVMADEDEDFDLNSINTAYAPRYPQIKKVSWWLVIGSAIDGLLLGIKRTTLNSNQTRVKVPFTNPLLLGQHSLKLYLVCDSYSGADQELDFSVNVQD